MAKMILLTCITLLFSGRAAIRLLLEAVKTTAAAGLRNNCTAFFKLQMYANLFFKTQALMTQFKDAVILITGGASGIGLLCGEMMLTKGAARLLMWDINRDNLEKESGRLRAKGHEVETMQVDVSDGDAVRQAAGICMERDWLPDILILNAGVVSGKYFHTHQADEMDQTIGVNVMGCLWVAHAFLPAMINRGRGHVVSIASAAGMLANPRMAVYAASKWAVLGWSESLRLEMQQLKTGIRVTTVTPSYIDTGMFAGARVNPLLPNLSPEKAVTKIVKGVQRNRRFVRMPALVYLIPLLKGLLPARLFDLLIGRGMGVYSSMAGFKGR